MKQKKLKSSLLFLLLAIGCTGLGGLLIKIGFIDEYIAQILTTGGIMVIISLSLNLISGFAGQLSLGQAGFMAIGAYSAAVSAMQFKLPLILCIVIGGLVTAVFGLLIGFPTLKLRGDYLAIVTLGFGEIIRVVLINLEGVTGGAAGLKGVPSFTGHMDEIASILWQPTLTFVWVIGFMFIVIALVSNLIKSSHGRAIISVREDEIAASSMGVGIYRYKVLAFTIASFIAGIGGALYAFMFGYLNPVIFNFMKSVDFLIILVFGGMGSIPGTVFAGFFLTYLQEALRFMQNYRMIFYPLLLIVIMIFVPNGVSGIFTIIKNTFKKKSKTNKTEGGNES